MGRIKVSGKKSYSFNIYFGYFWKISLHCIEGIGQLVFSGQSSYLREVVNFNIRRQLPDFLSSEGMVSPQESIKISPHLII